MGSLHLVKFAFLAVVVLHLGLVNAYWPSGWAWGKTKGVVQCEKSAFHKDSTWNERKYINGGGKCWIGTKWRASTARFLFGKNAYGYYKPGCLSVKRSELKLPTYMNEKNMWKNKQGIGQEQCIAACLKNKACSFITINWSVYGSLKQKLQYTRCRFYKIDWSMAGATKKQTSKNTRNTRNIYLVNVKEHCKLAGTPAPKPTVNHCCKTKKCKDYRGTIAVTEDGDTCQEWGKDTVHRNSGNDPANHPEAGLIKNYCRNPSKAEKPWCYTLNPLKKWGYCAIPQC